jgi:hypothetical protein
VPGDFDACWEVEGVDVDILDPVLRDTTNARAAQKAKYFGELFIVDPPFDTRFLDFFQRGKWTRAPKGIVVLELGDFS